MNPDPAISIHTFSRTQYMRMRLVQRLPELKLRGGYRSVGPSSGRTTTTSALDPQASTGDDMGHRHTRHTATRPLSKDRSACRHASYRIAVPFSLESNCGFGRFFNLTGNMNGGGAAVGRVLLGDAANHGACLEDRSRLAISKSIQSIQSRVPGMRLYVPVGMIVRMIMEMTHRQ